MIRNAKMSAWKREIVLIEPSDIIPTPAGEGLLVQG
jgi:hypothetical protein